MSVTPISDKLQEIREANRERRKGFAPNWKETLPDGSLWFPGSTGKSDCKICLGLGWIHQDLPFGHPEFGKLLKCWCAR